MRIVEDVIEFNYKKQFSFNFRQAKAMEVMLKYPDYLPVILQKHPDSFLQQTSKTKFLLNPQITMAGLSRAVRSLCWLPESQQLFFIVKNFNIRPTLFVYVDDCNVKTGKKFFELGEAISLLSH